jgi:hypothetical protein
MDNPARHRSGKTVKADGALAYALVLTVAGIGVLVACQGGQYAARGTGLIGCVLLATALARMVVPERYLGMLITRSKLIDVLAYGVLGGGVLGLALALPNP